MFVCVTHARARVRSYSVRVSFVGLTSRSSSANAEGSPFALARVGPGVRRVAAIALLLLDATASWRGWANETQAKRPQRRNAAIVENQTSKMEAFRKTKYNAEICLFSERVIMKVGEGV